MVPVLQSIDKNLQVVHGKVSREEPVDLDSLAHLIDRAFDQFKRHRFHHKHLNRVQFDQAVVCQLLEREASFILAAVEQKLEECQDAHLLVQVAGFFLDGWESRDEVCVFLHSLSKLSDLTSAQGGEQIVEPLEVAADQTVKDLFVKLYQQR